MNASGMFRSELNIRDEATGKEVYMERRTRRFDTHLLYDPTSGPHARVGGKMHMRRGVDYNSFVVAYDSWVELECNQDDDTIVRAQRLATSIAEAEVLRLESRFDKILGPANPAEE